MEVAGALEDPQVWNDPKRAQELGRERKSLETVVLGLESLTTALADHSELFEMSREEGDDATCEAIEADVEKSAAEVEALEFRRMFSNPLDPSNCFIDIQAGRSGGEARDLIFQTFVLAILTSLLLGWELVQKTVLLYPELVYFGVGIFDLFMGRYTGLRLTEYLMYRGLVKEDEEE